MKTLDIKFTFNPPLDLLDCKSVSRILWAYYELEKENGRDGVSRLFLALFSAVELGGGDSVRLVCFE